MEVAPSASLGERPEPVTKREFDACMAALSPFEQRPHVAVAVSGGSDSMALTLLAADWARTGGARLTALTVDHGLRAEAACEARQVGTWCAARGIAHEILTWAGPAPTSGIQAAARAARYQLLEEWCRGHEVLHLLVAHQREDQAETVLMRLARSSGGDGLSGMAAIVERGPVRVLRPLLALPRARLRATLYALAQDWVEDPSNRNPAYLRTRLRGELSNSAPGELTTERLAGLAVQFGRARSAVEIERADLLARSVMLHPAGFAWIDGAALFAAWDDIGLKALTAVITTLSGADYPPRGERAERLFRRLREGLAGGRTLGGCLVVPRRGKILVCREPAAVAAPVAVSPSGRIRWDGRFSLESASIEPQGLALGALGPNAAPLRRDIPGVAANIPGLVWPSLPAFYDRQGMVAVPALGYIAEHKKNLGTLAEKLLFCPQHPVTNGGFRIV